MKNGTGNFSSSVFLQQCMQCCKRTAISGYEICTKRHCHNCNFCACRILPEKAVCSWYSYIPRMLFRTAMHKAARAIASLCIRLWARCPCGEMAPGEHTFVLYLHHITQGNHRLLRPGAAQEQRNISTYSGEVVGRYSYPYSEVNKQHLGG